MAYPGSHVPAFVSCACLDWSDGDPLPSDIPAGFYVGGRRSVRVAEACSAVLFVVRGAWGVLVVPVPPAPRNLACWDHPIFGGLPRELVVSWFRSRRWENVEPWTTCSTALRREIGSMHPGEEAANPRIHRSLLLWLGDGVWSIVSQIRFRRQKQNSPFVFFSLPSSSIAFFKFKIKTIYVCKPLHIDHKGLPVHSLVPTPSSVESSRVLANGPPPLTV